MLANQSLQPNVSRDASVSYAPQNNTEQTEVSQRQWWILNWQRLGVPQAQTGNSKTSLPGRAGYRQSSE